MFYIMHIIIMAYKTPLDRGKAAIYPFCISLIRK